MAKKGEQGADRRNPKTSVMIEDIQTASKSLEGKGNYEKGYPERFNTDMHIGSSRTPKSKE
jgi:hypothetical protein